MGIRSAIAGLSSLRYNVQKCAPKFVISKVESKFTSHTCSHLPSNQQDISSKTCTILSNCTTTKYMLGLPRLTKRYLDSDAKHDGCVLTRVGCGDEYSTLSVLLAPHDPADYPNIKVVATAGEPCPLRTSDVLRMSSHSAHCLAALADKWAQSAHYYNCCGPTEVRRSHV